MSWGERVRGRVEQAKYSFYRHEFLLKPFGLISPSLGVGHFGYTEMTEFLKRKNSWLCASCQANPEEVFSRLCINSMLRK